MYQHQRRLYATKTHHNPMVGIGSACRWPVALVVIAIHHLGTAAPAISGAAEVLSINEDCKYFSTLLGWSIISHFPFIRAADVSARSGMDTAVQRFYQSSSYHAAARDHPPLE